MVGLTHDEAGPDAEGDVDGRGVRLGHRLAVEGFVRAVVDDHGVGGLVEERQVNARHYEQDEGVHGDLADHEGPVVGEDLVHGRAQPLRSTQAIVGPVQRLLLMLSPSCGRLNVRRQCS